MKTLEQHPTQTAQKLEIIGRGTKGSIEEIAKEYYEKAKFGKLSFSIIFDIIELAEDLRERVGHKKGMSHIEIAVLLGEEKPISLSGFNPEVLEEMIEFVRTTKDRKSFV